MSEVSELVQVLLIFGFLLCFLAFMVVVVIINPNKVKVEAKKEDDESIQEVCVELNSDEKQKS